jgi:hypothetical protein
MIYIVNGKIKSNIISLDEQKQIAFENMLKTVSNFDFIERNKGFFKYQQENLHKSNIYSIKLTNTRLNPANDKVLTKYKNISNFVSHLKTKLETVKIIDNI